MPDNGTRLDRIELILSSLALRQTELAERQGDFEQPMRHLLKAQVVLTDTVQKLTDHVQELAGRVQELAGHVLKLAHHVDGFAQQQQQHAEEHRKLAAETERRHQETEERFSTLVRMMDEWIRNNPRP